MKSRHFVNSLPLIASNPYWNNSTDLILYNANAYTINTKQTKAEAIPLSGIQSQVTRTDIKMTTFPCTLLD